MHHVVCVCAWIGCLFISFRRLSWLLRGMARDLAIMATMYGLWSEWFWDGIAMKLSPVPIFISSSFYPNRSSRVKIIKKEKKNNKSSMLNVTPEFCMSSNISSRKYFIYWDTFVNDPFCQWKMIFEHWSRSGAIVGSGSQLSSTSQTPRYKHL